MNRFLLPVITVICLTLTGCSWLGNKSAEIPPTYAEYPDAPTIEELVESNEDPTRTWLSYQDDIHHFFFKFPPTYSIKSSENTYILTDTGGNPVISVRIRAGTLESWQGNGPVADITLADRSGKSFHYQYCSSPDCNFAAVAYVIPGQAEGQIVALELIGDTEISADEQLIIESFRVW